MSPDSGSLAPRPMVWSPKLTLSGTRDHIYIHTYMHACIHTYMHACMHASIHPLTHPHTHRHTYIHYITLHYITLHYITLHYTHKHTHLSTYLPSYIPTYLRTYVPTYLRTYVHTYIHTYIHACMHACMHGCIHTYIPTYIHTYLHTYQHTYQHTNIPTYQHTTTTGHRGGDHGWGGGLGVLGHIYIYMYMFIDHFRVNHSDKWSLWMDQDLQCYIDWGMSIHCPASLMCWRVLTHGNITSYITWRYHIARSWIPNSGEAGFCALTGTLQSQGSLCNTSLRATVRVPKLEVYIDLLGHII